MIKPDVVLYEEPLDENTINSALIHILRADMLIVGGTSLQVYPAAGFVDYYSGDKMVLINRSTTSLDRKANLAINGKIGEVLNSVMQLIDPA